MKKLAAVLLACMSVAGASSSALAQWKPEHPVKLIVPNAAGGGADSFARLLADKVSKIWNQPVVVENHEGAAGRIGTQLAIRAEPDGYTILQAQNPLVVWPAIYKNMPFDAAKDLIPVTQVSNIVQVVTLNPSIPAKTPDELIAYAKEHPGEINFTSNGVGTQGHLTFSLFQKMNGIELTHIPYPGTPQRLAGMLANEVQLDIGALTLNQSPLDEKTLTGLVVTSAERLPSLPDVPTAKEAGHEELGVSAWDGIFVPAGTPAEIVDGIRAAYHQALADPEVVDQLLKQGRIPTPSSSEDFKAFMDKELAMYEEMSQAAGIEKSDAAQ